MASVPFLKCKNAESAKAMMRHTCSEERLKHTHSNEDINLALTSLNCNYVGGSYEEACKAYDERIKYLDSTTNTNIRKDRVTLVGLIIYVPDEITQNKDPYQFGEDVTKALQEKYGKDNVILSELHCDEIHSYLDVDGNYKISRPHIHAFVVPEVAGRLCAKIFTNENKYHEADKLIDDLCKNKYNCCYSTPETKHTGRYMSNNQIKAITNENMAKRAKELQRMENRLNNLSEQYERQKTSYIQDAENTKKQYQNELLNTQDELQNTQDELQNTQNELQNLKDRANKINKAIGKVNNDREVVAALERSIGANVQAEYIDEIDISDL